MGSKAVFGGPSIPAAAHRAPGTAPASAPQRARPRPAPGPSHVLFPHRLADGLSAGYAPASTGHAAITSMPVNGATYTHTCTHSLIHTCTYIHMHTSVCAEARTYIHVHAHICTLSHMHTHVCIPRRPQPGELTQIHILLSTYTCMCIYTQTHTLTGILGQVCALLAHLSFVSLIRGVLSRRSSQPLCRRW